VTTFDAPVCAALARDLTKIAVGASQAILNWVGRGGVQYKADGSPVTAADEIAEAMIREDIARHVPGVPIVSEEQAAREKPRVAAGATYFLVDPLDGTREFIAGRNEYTVNIALVTGSTPIIGVIAAPALGLVWRGSMERGAERLEFADGNVSAPTAIHIRPRPKRELVIMASRSHLEARTRAFIERFPQAKLEQCGSSIKFCRVAEGKADLYPRLAPTHDWDVAAGHAIVTAAGGQVAAPDGSPIVYGSTELIIPAFLAAAEPVTA
jgi:3'(2'), 5'-bisphosphate nucleotidase